MNTKSNKNFSIFLLLSGTLLVGFSMGRWLFPLAAWIGPALILRYARDHKAGRGYLFIFAACILAFLIGFSAITAFLLPLPMVFILAFGYGLLWSLPYLADRLMYARMRSFSTTFVFPLVATVIEFVNIRTNPMGSFGAMGFTQYGNLPLMQLASVTGMIGITFLMAWFASVVNWAWENRSRGVEILRGLAAFVAVLSAVFIFGFLRLNFAPSGETVRVAGITPQSGLPLLQRWLEMSDPAAVHLEVQSHWDVYFDATVREAHAGAKVIVWPEGAGVVPSSDETSFIAQAKEVASQNGIYLAIGMYAFPDGFDMGQLSENKLLLIDPTGAIVIEHFKYGGRILDPYRVQGDGKLQTVETPFGVLSGVVCWDLDYPAIIQQAGQNSTGLLLDPSNDWFAVDPLHSHMAVFPAIENGMSIVRQTSHGLSIAVDPYGRVLAQTEFFNSTDRTMVAQVPVGHVSTIYTAFGHWFEWICLIGFLYIVAYVIAQALIARRKVK